MKIKLKRNLKLIGGIIAVIMIITVGIKLFTKELSKIKTYSTPQEALIDMERTNFKK